MERRCPYCAGMYNVEPGDHVERFTTADVVPKGHVEIRVNGRQVHYCQLGSPGRLVGPLNG